VYISEFTFVIFQGAFAAITCGLIVGAFAERAKFSAILVFMVLWFTFSYLPMAHMVWYWAGPDAYTDAAAAEAAGRPQASCSRRVRSTSLAVRSCISTPLWPA
jgi:Amt family ammonium transporter